MPQRLYLTADANGLLCRIDSMKLVVIDGNIKRRIQCTIRRIPGQPESYYPERQPGSVLIRNGIFLRKFLII
jgi:hypothetical protein